MAASESVAAAAALHFRSLRAEDDEVASGVSSSSSSSSFEWSSLSGESAPEAIQTPLGELVSLPSERISG